MLPTICLNIVLSYLKNKSKKFHFYKKDICDFNFLQKNFLKNKKMFKHEILKEDNLKYIFDTTDNVEVHYGEHPGTSLGLLFKKS